MKKILASILAITMLMTTLSACVIPVSAADVATDGFVETFENYGEGNWLANMVEGTTLVDNTKFAGMEENAWTVYGGNGNSSGKTIAELLAANASISVVSNPEKDAVNSSDKVLKLDAGDLGANGWVRVRRNSNGEAGIARADMTGKKMVIKAKFYRPADFNMTDDSTGFTYDQNKQSTRIWMNSNMTSNHYPDKWKIFAVSKYGNNANASRNQSITNDEWFDVKYVIDLTEHKTENHPADTYRAFYKDSIQTANYGEFGTAANATAVEVNSKFPQPSTTTGVAGDKIVESYGAYINVPGNAANTFTDFGPFYGTSMTVSGANNSTTDYFYMDDVEVYYITPFKQEGDLSIVTPDEATGNWYKGEIEIPFNNDLMEVVKENETTLDYKSLFTLKDGDTVVDDGIATARVDGNKLYITPVISAEARNKEYTIYASPLFMDAEGQGLNQFSKEQAIGSFTAVKDPFAHIYVDEDFENYTDLTSNWVLNTDASGYVKTDAGVEANSWMVGSYVDSRCTVDSGTGTVKVVKDPLDTGRGNVLMLDTSDIKVTATKDDYDKNITVVKKPIDNGYTKRADMDGKRIVIQADVYIPSDGYALGEDTIFAYYNATTINTRYPNKNILPYNSMGSRPYVIGQGSSHNTFDANRPRHTSGKWYTYRYVIDVSEQPTKDRIDTVRGYIDGTLVAAPVGENTVTATTNENYPLYEDDGETPRVTVDFWKRGGNPFDNVSTYGSAGDFKGLFMANRPGPLTGGSAYYIDNMKAYYVEDFKLKNDADITNYAGGAITLEFTGNIPEEFKVMKSATAAGNLGAAVTMELEDLIILKDKDGNQVEFKKIYADGNKVVMIPDVESNSEYEIEISRYFHDVEGQGLTKNSTETTIGLSTGEITNLQMIGEVSRDSFTGFDTGRTVEFTATFNKAISTEMIEKGIVVKNTDTNEEVPYESGKWSYEFVADEDGNVDNKTIKLIFTYLDKANYEITTDEDFGYGEGDNLPEAFVVTIAKPAGAIVLFDENFETGYGEGNWLDTATKSGSIYTVPAPDGKGSWDIQLAGNPTEFTDFVGVVDAPKTAENGMSGKVLKVFNERSTAYTTNYTAIRRNFDKDYTPYRFDEGEYAGKVLVYEADMFAINATANIQTMQPSINKNTLLTYKEGIWKCTTNASGSLSLSGGSYNDKFNTYGHAASWFRTSSTNNFKDAPTKVRMVIDQSTELDTMRMYVGGVMHTYAPEKVAMLKGHPMNDMEGRYDFGPAIENPRMNNADQEWNMNTAKQAFGSSSIGDNKGVYGIYSLASIDSNASLTKPGVEIYFDNFKAYLVDSFDILNVEGNSDVFNTAKASVTYTFSKKVDTSTVKANESIVLLDAEGNEVAGGIKSVTPADGDYQLIVKLNENLPTQTKYTIKVMSSLRDIDGLSLRTQYSYYLYDIDAHYNKVVGKDNVYLIERVNSTETIEGTYTPRVMENGKVVSPAYLTYYKADGTVAANAATDMYVKDEAKMMTKVDIVTSEFQSLFAKATDAVINGNKVTTTVTITNPELEEMDVWCVVAVFGEYNEMLGCTPVAVGNDKVPNGNTDAIPVEVDVENGSAVKSVKLFVWDSYDNMKPYHKASTVNYTNN